MITAEVITAEVITAVLKASDLLNSQLSRVMQFDSHEALHVEYYVCNSYGYFSCSI